MHTAQSRDFWAQQVGCAQPDAFPTWSTQSRVPQHFRSPLHFLMLSACPELPPSSLLPSKEGQLQGCPLWHTFQNPLLEERPLFCPCHSLPGVGFCLEVGASPTFFSVHGGSPADAWSQPGWMGWVRQGGLGASVAPVVSVSATCFPLSFLVMASGPDSSGLAGNWGADARRCEGGFS